jgi:phosphate/sulfate permease
MTAIAFLAYSNKTFNLSISYSFLDNSHYFFNYARSYQDYLWGLEHTNNYVTVFIISPVLGAVVATVIYATFNELFPAAKRKEDRFYELFNSINNARNADELFNIMDKHNAEFHGVSKKEEPVKKESVKEPVNEPVKEPVKETTSAAATPSSGGSTRKRTGSRSRK